MQMQDVFTQWDSLMKISSFTSREPNYILKLKGQQIFCTNTHFFYSHGFTLSLFA